MSYHAPLAFWNGPHSICRMCFSANKSSYYLLLLLWILFNEARTLNSAETRLTKIRTTNAGVQLQKHKRELSSEFFLHWLVSHMYRNTTSGERAWLLLSKIASLEISIPGISAILFWPLGVFQGFRPLCPQET